MVEKYCSVCAKPKTQENNSKNKSSPDGLKSICKECVNRRTKERYTSVYNRSPGMTTEELKAYRKRWYYKNKDRIKHYRLKATYGISIDTYNMQCDKQQNLCACCGKKVEILYVDHCHHSQVIRGLLCFTCNAGIGLLGDNIEGLERALRYLKQKDLMLQTESSKCVAE